MNSYARAVIGEEGYCIGPNPECGCADCEQEWSEYDGESADV